LGAHKRRVVWAIAIHELSDGDFTVERKTHLTCGRSVSNFALFLVKLHGVEAIPYVRDFIETVRKAGIAYCVATSARVSKMHITLGQTGLLPLFEHAMFSSTMVARGKPFPDLFLHAARTMGVAPADCIVIEDSVAGTEAGIAAGMRVFSYYADPFSDRDGLAAAGGILFDDMRELAGLVPIR